MDTDSAFQFLLPFPGPRSVVAPPPACDLPLICDMAQKFRLLSKLRVSYIRLLSEEHSVRQIATQSGRTEKNIRCALYESARLLGAPQRLQNGGTLIDQQISLLVAAFRQASALPVSDSSVEPNRQVNRDREAECIRDKIRAHSVRLNLSATELARLCGLRHNKVQQILGGQSVPSAVDMLVLSAVLGVTVSELYGLTE